MFLLRLDIDRRPATRHWHTSGHQTGGGRADVGHILMRDLYERQERGRGLAAREGWLCDQEVLWVTSQLLLEDEWSNEESRHKDAFTRGGYSVMVAQSSTYA